VRPQRRSPSLATAIRSAGELVGCFFGNRDKRVSLVIIGLLDGAVVAGVLTLRRENPVPALLITPYLACSGFATALNAAISATR
jgi:translocator protein